MNSAVKQCFLIIYNFKAGYSAEQPLLEFIYHNIIRGAMVETLQYNLLEKAYRRNLSWNQIEKSNQAGVKAMLNANIYIKHILLTLARILIWL